MRLIETTQKEVIENCEKYFYNKQQFLLENDNYFRVAIITRFEDWDDSLHQEIWRYRFEYESYDRDCLEENIEHIYIIEK